MLLTIHTATNAVLTSCMKDGWTRPNVEKWVFMEFSQNAYLARIQVEAVLVDRSVHRSNSIHTPFDSV